MGDSADSTGSPLSTAADCSLVPVERSGTDPSSRSGPSPSGKPRWSIINIPPDVVLIIFQSFLPSVDHKSLYRAGICRSYMNDLCTLRLVSTSWRNLLDATASFWVVISSTFPWSVNDTNITRSCNAPIIVYCGMVSLRYRSRADTSSHQAHERFLRLLGHTRDRWKVVWMEISSPNTVPQYLASAASLIEAVRLGNALGNRPPFHLLGGETHNVQHLDLHNVAIHWDVSSFRKLRSLKLEGHVGEWMTTNLVLEVLANNPSLETLKVINVEIHLSETPFPHTIRLLQLQSIKLTSLGFHGLDHLLRHVEAPHCQEISIQGDHTPDSSFNLEESLRSFEPLLLDLHKKNGSSKFYARPFLTHWRSLGNSDDLPSFDVLVYSTPFASSLHWVERVLENIDREGLEVTLDLDGGEAVVEDPEVMSTLRRLRCVTDIGTLNPKNSRGIVDFLSDQSVPSSQNVVPLLPSLRRLRVSYAHVTFEEILHMVRTRFAQSLHTTFKVHDLEISPGDRRPIGSMPSRIINFATITEIRSIDGVTLNMYNHSSTPGEGRLAVVWDEEKGRPTWGQ